MFGPGVHEHISQIGREAGKIFVGIGCEAKYEVEVERVRPDLGAAQYREEKRPYGDGGDAIGGRPDN